MAIGAPGNYFSNDSSYSGRVRVYEWNAGSWQQKGDDIDGEAANDYFGGSVSLSSDGTVMAIGAPGNYHSSYSGRVRVYKWNANTLPQSWEQMGDGIDGEAAADKSGWSVSLSSDGTAVAIGARGNDDNGTDSGHVRVYKWNETSSSWQQKGDNIDGEAAGDEFGTSVSLSSDGNVVAIGAPYNDGTGTSAGHVRVYKWNTVTTSWDQMGTAIDGEAANDQSGKSVSLSNDGTVLAIGAFGNGNGGYYSGHVRVYEWDVDAFPPSWHQRGDDIDGEFFDWSGYSVSLSSDGTILAIGATDNGIDSGHVRVYEWNAGTSDWDQRGDDIDGEAAGDFSGWSVSLSSDGSVLAIGAPYNDGYGTSSGHVRVYEFSS